MADNRTADILPFPVRQAAKPLATPAAAAPDRLSTALSSLNAAMAEQQQAVARWRQAIEDLSASMKRLGSVPMPDVTPRAS